MDANCQRHLINKVSFPTDLKCNFCHLLHPLDTYFLDSILFYWYFVYPSSHTMLYWLWHLYRLLKYLVRILEFIFANIFGFLGHHISFKVICQFTHSPQNIDLITVFFNSYFVFYMILKFYLWRHNFIKNLFLHIL